MGLENYSFVMIVPTYFMNVEVPTVGTPTPAPPTTLKLKGSYFVPTARLLTTIRTSALGSIKLFHLECCLLFSLLFSLPNFRFFGKVLVKMTRFCTLFPCRVFP